MSFYPAVQINDEVLVDCEDIGVHDQALTNYNITFPLEGRVVVRDTACIEIEITYCKTNSNVPILSIIADPSFVFNGEVFRFYKIN